MSSYCRSRKPTISEKLWEGREPKGRRSRNVSVGAEEQDGGRKRQAHSRIFVVNVVTEARGVYDGEADAGAVLFEFDVDGLDADALLDVGGFGVVADLVTDGLRVAEGVYEGGLACAGCADDHEAEGDTLLGSATARSHAGVDDGRNGGQRLCARWQCLRGVSLQAAVQRGLE
ncbi:hypothetical protein L1887_50567 [Cichorium endivia]|nr:hypothetical protein L1887_50567 [Cichorium endivia]